MEILEGMYDYTFTPSTTNDKAKIHLKTSNSSDATDLELHQDASTYFDELQLDAGVVLSPHTPFSSEAQIYLYELSTTGSTENTLDLSHFKEVTSQEENGEQTNEWVLKLPENSFGERTEGESRYQLTLSETDGSSLSSVVLEKDNLEVHSSGEIYLEWEEGRKGFAMYDQSEKGYRLTPVINDAGEDAILLKNPNGLGGSYAFGDSLSLKAEQFIDLLPEAVTSSPIAQALANVADGYEADLSYGLEFNAGMIFGYDAGATEVGSFFYLDPRAARPAGEYWPKEGSEALWSYSTTEDDYTASMAEILLQFGAGVDRLQRPDRFLISNENVQYNSEEKTLSFPLDEKKFGSIYTSTEKKEDQRIETITYHLNSTSATNIFCKRKPGGDINAHRDRAHADSTESVYKAILPEGVSVRSDFKSEVGDPTIKLRTNAYVEFPNVRDSLGMDAAIALDWFNHDTTVNQESEQR